MRRAAKLFEEYKYQVQQNSFKKSVAGGSFALTGPISEQSISSIPLPASATNLLEPKTETTKSDGIPFKKSSKTKSDKVSMIVKTDAIDNSLKMLDDVLHPYLSVHDPDVHVKDDTQADFEERERQVQQLHNNITGLKANLEHSKLVATVKVKNHVTDNLHLLKEVNDLRHDVSFFEIMRVLHCRLLTKL